MTEKEKHLELRKKSFIVPEQIQLIFNQYVVLISYKN